MTKQVKDNNQQAEPVEIKGGTVVPGENGGYQVHLSRIQQLVFFIRYYLQSENLTPQQRAEFEEDANFLERTVSEINIQADQKRKTIKDFQFNLIQGKNEEQAARVTAVIKKDYIKGILYFMLGLKLPTGNPVAAKFKKSGHFIDQTLKYSNPKQRQLSIFDQLQPKTRELIKSAGVDVEMVNKSGEGIKLTPGEYKLIDCICDLLHEKSQHEDVNATDYFMGNGDLPAEVIKYGNLQVPAPKLMVTIYEITKRFKGGEHVSGQDMANVNKLLNDLSDDPTKKALIRYSRVTKNKNGKSVDTIEEYQSLIRVLNLKRTEYNDDDMIIAQKEETAILLNPIFRDQIDSKFVLYPKDIVKRMIAASGSANIPEITYKLRDYLAREHSNKRFTPSISLDNLYWTLAEGYMRASRKKLVREQTEKAFDTVKSIGLLKSYEIKPGVGGEPIVHFKLNRKWE